MNAIRHWVIRIGYLSVLMLVIAPAVVQAAVRADVDRATVQVNESFTLTVTADGNETGEPDLGVLEEQFSILGRNTRTTDMIVDGRRESTRHWRYVLLPKTPGSFTIPSVTVDGVSSAPIAVTVEPVTAVPLGDADVFIEVELDRDRSWVQAQVIYTIKLYLAVAVRQTDFGALDIDGGEVLIERLGEDKTYESQIGERLYTVVERRYALFPQVSGDYTIAPMRFTASLWERGRLSSPRVFTSAAKTLRIDPVVPPPAQWAGAAWLPAEDVALSAQMRPEDGILDTGEPASVRLKLQVTGLLSPQLPELSIDEQEGLRVYPDKADLQSRALARSVAATREQGFAIIAGRGGVFRLPEVRLPWFNVNTGQWEVETLSLPPLRAAGDVIVAPPEVASLPAEAAPNTAVPSAGDESVSIADRNTINKLKLIIYGLLGLWLVTLWLFWQVLRRRKVQRKKARLERDSNAPFRATQKALKNVQRACAANDPRAASSALLIWGQHYWPEARIRTLGDISARAPDAARAAIEVLNRHLYGNAPTGWDGRLLRHALAQLHRVGADSKVRQQATLPPLLGSG